jgi:hypothetical protein
VYSAAINTGVQISLVPADVITFGYKFNSGIAGSCLSFIYNVLRNLHTVFPKGVPNHVPTRCTQVFCGRIIRVTEYEASDNIRK